jgi:integrase/recombinase XerD
MTRPTAQDALTEEELEHLLAQIATAGPAGKRNLALLTLMADTGLRVAEALTLATGDLVKKGGVITHVQVRHGKGGKTASLPVTLRAAARLGEWLESRAVQGVGNGAVFCTISRGRHFTPQAGPQGFIAGAGAETTLEPGRPVSARYVRQVLDRLAEKAGLERHISPHTLRHTFATHLLRMTGNLELTRKALRHSRVTTTAEVYSHLLGRDVEEAVLALRGEGASEEAPLPQALDLAGRLAAMKGQLETLERQLAAISRQGGTDRGERQSRTAGGSGRAPQGGHR